MNITKRSDFGNYLKRWMCYGLLLVVLLPLLAACMNDDDEDEPTAMPGGIGTTATESEPGDDATGPEGDVTATTGDGSGTAAEDAATQTETVEPASTPAESSATGTQAESTAEETAAEVEPIAGDRPVDRQLNWLLTVINGETPPDEEIELHLHPSFFEAVTLEEFTGLMGQLQQGGPWEFSGYLGEPIALDGDAVISAPGGQLQISAGLEIEEPNRFVTLLFFPYEAPSLAFNAFEEVDGWLAQQAPLVTFQAAEISDGDCHAIHEVNPDESLAVASAFKLWVLLELAERIAAGELSWRDTLALSDDLKSAPSGTMQVEEAGSEFELQTYAAKMIALSDNTATDHLIDFLGREAVEARFEATGHGAPERNMPLLLTRELFYIKGALSQAELDAYIAADTAGRREILANLNVDLTQIDPNRLAMPLALDSVEWFASASDLCGVLSALHEASAEDETLRDILAIASGGTFDSEFWNYAGFKGGNEAGVAAGAWLLERADGRVFSITVALNNPDAGVNPAALSQLASAVAGLLAEVE